MKKKIILTLVIIAWFVIGWVLRGIFTNPETRLFDEARTIITNDYYGQLPDERNLTHTAIKAMLMSIGDVRANFLEPDMVKRYIDHYNGGHGKIGLMGEIRDGAFEITMIKKDYPADKAGIKTGDRIVKIDDWIIPSNATLLEIGMHLTGQEGSKAELFLNRDNEKYIVTITRGKPKIFDYSVKHKIAHIKLYDFTMNSPELIKPYIEEAVRLHYKGIVLDLRDNPGGAGEAAHKILNYFIEDGILFEAKYKNGYSETYKAKKKHCIAPDIPLVVLVNKDSASCAEVTAAAVKETKRGTVIGETTYGKGTVNMPYFLSDGSMVILTAKGWFSPKGNSYQNTGIKPDIVIAGTDDDTDRVLENAFSLLVSR